MKNKVKVILCFFVLIFAGCEKKIFTIEDVISTDQGEVTELEKLEIITNRTELIGNRSDYDGELYGTKKNPVMIICRSENAVKDLYLSYWKNKKKAEDKYKFSDKQGLVKEVTIQDMQGIQGDGCFSFDVNSESTLPAEIIARKELHLDGGSPDVFHEITAINISVAFGGSLIKGWSLDNPNYVPFIQKGWSDNTVYVPREDRYFWPVPFNPDSKYSGDQESVLVWNTFISSADSCDKISNIKSRIVYTDNKWDPYGTGNTKGWFMDIYVFVYDCYSSVLGNQKKTMFVRYAKDRNVESSGVVHWRGAAYADDLWVILPM